MITVRQIWGPFGFRRKEHGGRLESLRWYFHGVRDDYRVAAWTLAFDLRKDKFHVTSRSLKRDLLPCSDTHDMFLSVPGGKIETGLAADLLKKRLSKEDFAQVARARITGKI